MLMNRMPKRRYNKKKKTTSHKVQLTEEDYINKTSGWQQNIVSNPRAKAWKQLKDSAVWDT